MWACSFANVLGGRPCYRRHSDNPLFVKCFFLSLSGDGRRAIAHAVMGAFILALILTRRFVGHLRALLVAGPRGD
jgi:hypothetical protein